MNSRTTELGCRIYCDHGLPIKQGEPYGDTMLLAIALERELAEAKRALSDSSFRWIPVSERMPPAVPRSSRSWAFEDDRQFLARNSAGYCACVTAIYRDLDGSLGGECATPEATRDVIGEVTEWAPLPEAPKEGRT